MNLAQLMLQSYYLMYIKGIKIVGLDFGWLNLKICDFSLVSKEEITRFNAWAFNCCNRVVNYVI